MSEFIIITDSCIDLPDDLATELELAVIPLSVNVEGKVYRNYLDGREISTSHFYQLLRKNVIPTTSQVNPNEFVEIMEQYLQKEYDILYIGFSSALSGTYQSSLIAKEDLSKKYPERKIITVDSLSASMGYGLLVTYAARLKKQGRSLEEVASWVNENKLRLSHLFTVGDLNHLKRGGRLSSSKAFLGTIIRIKPLLHVDKEGRLIHVASTRGRKASLKKLVDRMAKTIECPEEQVVYISHGDCLDEVKDLKAKILERINVKEIIVNHVGPVIGAHSGVGTIAIFYLGTDRFDSY